MQTSLCGRCLKTYGSRTKLEDHMTRCIEQEICNILYMNPNKKIKFNDWYMKLDPPMWIDADFECMNNPVDDPHQNIVYKQTNRSRF